MALTEFKRLRLEAGLTQREVAEAARIRQERLSYIENGLHPKPAEALRLMKILEAVTKEQASQ